MIQWIKDVLEKSWIIKIFLVFLALSFGIWGIGDFLTPGMDPRIALSVGKREIKLDEVQRRFGRELDRMKQSMGPIDSDEIMRSILNVTVQDITREATLDAASQELGLVVTTDHLRKTIREDGAFKDETGAFNGMLYDRLLQENRLTESAFIELYSSSIRQRTLLQPVVESSAAPKMLVNALFAFRGETRIADTLLIKTASVPAPPKLTEDELKKFYGDNITTFTAPEYRKVKAVTLNSDDLFSPDSLTEEQLKTFYDENTDRYRTRETKRVAQIVFDTKEQVDAARALAVTGDHLEEVAKKSKTSVIDLGELTKTSPLAKTIGAAYDLPVGEVSQPVQSDLGWHLFEVKNISPEVVKPFDSVRDEIRKTLAAEKGLEALDDAAQALEDAVVAGEPMADVAVKVHGKLIAIEAMDYEGKDPRALQVNGLIDNDRFIKTAFTVPSGGESKLLEIPKGYYMLKVESVTPPTPKPFDDVRNEVAAMAEKQKRMDAAQELATKIEAEIKADTALAALASKSNASYAPLGPINRFGEAPKRELMIDSARVSPDLLEKLFEAKVGAVVSAPVVDGVVVARLREVVPVPAEEAAKAEQQVTSSIRQGIGGDLADAMTQAFSSRYPSEVNQGALDTIATSTR